MKGRRKVKFPHLLGSKWTAAQPLMGWRHYQVIGRQERNGTVFALMRSVCQPDIEVWVNARTLSNRDLWEPGWTPLNEIAPLEANVATSLETGA